MTDDRRLVLVTGPSGAGRSTAINALEDLGFETIDNLPLSLLPALLEDHPQHQPLALGIDARTREFSTSGFVDLLARLNDLSAVPPEVLYLDCSEDILLRRYSETRRRHPLAPNETPLVGVRRDMGMLEPLRDRADFVIDTGDLTPHDLRAEIGRFFGTETGQQLSLSIHSFSYKRGTPRGIDMMFDCRFLRNPHWKPELRDRDGRDAPVVAYVEADPRHAEFVARIEALTDFLLPAYIDEGKSHFAIGFGCTGGQHRSVAVAEAVARTLAEKGWQVSIRHRELDRAGRTGTERANAIPDAKIGVDGA